MVSKNKINRLWSTYLGEFYNKEHNLIKSNLLNFFDQYIKKNPNSRKREENHKLYESSYPYTEKVNRVIVSVNLTVSLLENNKPILSD